MTVRNGHIALAYAKLNRLGTDGSSNGMDFNGPSVSFNLRIGENDRIISPTSIAFSPDNKYLYLTGYIYKLDFWEASGNCYHVVYRMEYAKNEPPTVLIGKVDTDKAIGTDNKSFCVPTSLDVDDKGRLYVSDFGNNRIQVFSADGEYLKTIPTSFPAKVVINPKTQEIIVFSWKVIGPSEFVWKSKNLDLNKLPNTMSNLGTFENPKEGTPEVLPIKGGTGSGGWTENGGQIYSVVVDPYAEKESLWAVGRQPTLTLSEFGWSAGGYGQTSGWMARGIKVYQKLEGKWTETVDFAKKALGMVKKIEPPILGFQSLHFNPSDQHLYVGEDPTFSKSYDELIKINPENGELSIQPLPTNVCTISFWYHDIAYLRTDIGVMRVNSKTWKEIPWDYGVEVDNFFFDSGSAPRRSMPSVSNLKLPPMRPVHWILMSMDVNAKGNLAVACYAASAGAKAEKNEAVYQSKTSNDVYKLVNYPGRGSPYFVNIWDKSGKLLKEDCFPGMPFTDGLGIDQNNDIYTLIGGVRYLNEKDSFTEFTETLVKAVPNKGRIITTSERALVVLPQSEAPKRAPDISVPGFGKSWIENAEWMYGGVSHGAQGGCACWHGGFKLDLLGRSFVPESNQYQIAILDSSGNLIMRVGQYCNADSYGANSPVPLGGNEIGMMMAHTVEVETDKRLFIADTGNERLLSVKLDYEVNVNLPIFAK